MRPCTCHFAGRFDLDHRHHAGLFKLLGQCIQAIGLSE